MIGAILYKKEIWNYFKNTNYYYDSSDSFYFSNIDR